MYYTFTKLSLSDASRWTFHFQVNPHTHQLKLCDFGSAKVLVSSFWTLYGVEVCCLFLLNLFNLVCGFFRWKVNLMFHTFAQDTTVPQNSYLVPLSTLLQLIYGRLDVWWLSYFSERWSTRKIIWILRVFYSRYWWVMTLLTFSAPFPRWKWSRPTSWDYQGGSSIYFLTFNLFSFFPFLIWVKVSSVLGRFVIALKIVKSYLSLVELGRTCVVCIFD